MQTSLASISRFIYGPSPTEQVKSWQQQIRKESRLLDREILSIDKESQKVIAQIKVLGKKGDLKNAKLLAREVILARKQGERLNLSKTRLNSISMQLNHQLATVKITGTLQKSTEILKLSNSLIKLPQLQKTMESLSTEMMKAGILEEMIGDTMDEMEDEEEMEEEGQAELDEILFSVTDGKLGVASAKVGQLPQKKVEMTLEEKEADEEIERAIAGLLNS